MTEFFPILLVVLTSFAVAALQASRFSRPESRWVLGSFGAHVVSSFAQVWFTHAMYGSGDMTTYARTGEALATAMRWDPGQFVPEVLKLLFHQLANLPVDVIGAGTSSGTMSALAGLLILATGGGVYTASCCVAVGAHFGQVALYRGLRAALPEAPIQRVLFSALFVPSMVFWSSALVKEGVASLGLGYAFLGVQRLLQKRWLGAAAPLAFGAVVIGIVKPYILVALAVAATAAFVFNTPKRRDLLSRPLNILGGALFGALSTALLLRLFPNYSPEAIAEEAARLQEVGQVSVGGSSYSFGDPTQRSLAGQLAFAPLALITSLFRPFIFEAKSMQIFVNAIETTTILFLFSRMLYRKGVARTWAAVVGHPMHVFSAVFILIFGVGVGLATTNLGTLSRYRMPLVAFLWVFVLVIGARQGSAAAATAIPRVPPGRPLRVHARSASADVTGAARLPEA